MFAPTQTIIAKTVAKSTEIIMKLRLFMTNIIKPQIVDNSVKIWHLSTIFA